MKKVLVVATVISFIEWFNQENIEFLRDQMGCEVHIAVNTSYFQDTDELRTKRYLGKIRDEGIIVHNIPFVRSPFSRGQSTAYRELKRLIKAEHFDLIHCHTPNASALTRLAARKTRKDGTVVMYSCHGFHFHQNAPLVNWVLYYPIERVLSRFCDYLVTINREDFHRAESFHCKNVRYIPGVGVDTNRFKNAAIERNAYRRSSGIPEDALLVLSVGELIPRKDHETILHAVAKLSSTYPRLCFAIAGKGPLHDHLREVAEKAGIADKLFLLGFRTDIPELYHAADIAALPSRIEGLGLSGIEALSAGVPLIASDIQGIRDYVQNGVNGFLCRCGDLKAFTEAIEKLVCSPELRKQMQMAAMESVAVFDKVNALKVMQNIYRETLE